jgi:membrane dipeptidase
MTTVNQLDPAHIHSSALVIDTHADTSQRFVDESWDFLSPLGSGHINLESARLGNLGAEFFAIWPEPVAWRGRFAHRTLVLIDSVLEQIRRHSGELALCLSPADILDARAAGKFSVLMGVEGGHAIENSLALLRVYHMLGVRYMTLTWANSITRQFLTTMALPTSAARSSQR